MTISINIRNSLQKSVDGTKKPPKKQGFHIFMLLPEYTFCLSKKKTPNPPKQNKSPTKQKQNTNPPVVFFSRKSMCKGKFKQWQVLNVQLWSWNSPPIQKSTTNTKRHHSSCLLKSNYGTITTTKQKYSQYIVFISMIAPYLPSMLEWPKPVTLAPNFKQLVCPIFEKWHRKSYHVRLLMLALH